MQTPNEAKAPILKYALPFGALSETVFSLPERTIKTVRQGKNGNGPSTSTLLGNAMIPMGENGGIEVSIWESSQDTPDGFETSTSFSFPRNLALPKDNYGKRSKEYFEARDVENGYKHSVVTAFLEWRTNQEKQKKNTTGGSVVRLVKKNSQAA